MTIPKIERPEPEVKAPTHLEAPDPSIISRTEDYHPWQGVAEVVAALYARERLIVRSTSDDGLDWAALDALDDAWGLDSLSE